MAEEIAQLGIEIKSGDIVKATRRLDKLENQSKKSEKTTKKLTNSFKGMGAALGGLGLGLAFKSIISLAIEQERVIKQVDAAIKSTGGSAGFTTEELQKMAAGFQNVTNFGDEAILSMQSVLLTFTNLKGDVLPATTEAVLDLSERMGIDLQSAAVQLGKALNDPIANLSALSRSGIQFSESQKEVIKDLVKTNQLAKAQGLILDELKTQFGGSAKAARDTFGGALKSLGNAFGDLLEGDGGNLNDAKGAIEELTKIMQDEGTKAAFGSIVTLVVGITKALATMIGKLSSGGKHLGEFLANALAPATTSDRIDDIKDRMGELSNIMRVTQDAFEGSPMAKQFTDARDELARLVEEFNALGGTAFAPTVTTPKDSGSKDGKDKKDKPAFSILPSEEELDADFERMSEWQDKVLQEIKDTDEAKLQARRSYLSALYDMETGSLKAISSFADAVRSGDVKSALNHGKVMLSNLGKVGKEGFEIQKAASLASAVAELPSAVMSSFKNGGGFPWGLAPAGEMLATGLKQISSIASTSYKSKTSSASVGGASAAPRIPTASTLPAQSLPDLGQATSKPKEVNITLNGAGYSRDNVRELIESINEEIGDGAILVAV